MLQEAGVLLFSIWKTTLLTHSQFLRALACTHCGPLFRLRWKEKIGFHYQKLNKSDQAQSQQIRHTDTMRQSQSKGTQGKNTIGFSATNAD